MKRLDRVCVFCGSKVGHSPIYRETAEALGTLLAERGITLVWGGGQIGLMGVLADSVLSAGGKAIGVIPQVLARTELLHPAATEMHVVDSMHARKAKMNELSDAFITLPGGYGTLDELFEAVTWLQLGIHLKPIGLLDVDGFFGPVWAMLGRAHKEGFLSRDSRQLILFDHDAGALLDRLAEFDPPSPTKAPDAQP
jgi:uncharacterized protein (TIGR00730 family)